MASIDHERLGCKFGAAIDRTLRYFRASISPEENPAPEHWLLPPLLRGTETADTNVSWEGH